MDDFMSDVLALQMQYDCSSALKQVARCLAQLRSTSAILTIQAADIYMEVVLKQGTTVSELIKRTGLSQASCSQNLALLSKMQRHGKPRFELAVSVDDRYERRRKVVYLTSRGGELAAALADILN